LQKKIKKNILRVLDCKVDNCQDILKDAPNIVESLCETCDTDFIKLKSMLDSSNIEYEIDSNLVRGLDYYNKTAFEFIADDLAIAGGGIYDKLVEELGGKPTPAVGYAIGIDRIMDLIVLPKKEREGYFFGTMIEEGLDLLFLLAQKKRKTSTIIIEDRRRNVR